ncbi:S8 family serine peptidase [Undibacterium sp. GrIS 1.2]|uniref:S8 family serine peptidase n=1 Tax=Undibacterium sp. GrIS 1.2 TaxID=3143933 RepID=UPI0033951C34
MPPKLLNICRLLLVAFCCNADPVWAQLRLPSINLPVQQLGNLNSQNLLNRIDRLDQLVRTDVLNGTLPLQDLRLTTITRLLKEHPLQLENNPKGELIVRKQITAWSPSVAALKAVRAAGFIVISEHRLETLEETLVVLQAPPDMSTADALDLLHQLDQDGTYDYNHIYLESGSAIGSSFSISSHSNFAAPFDSSNSLASSTLPETAKANTKARIGLIDSGIDTEHIVFKDAQIKRHDCTDKNIPTAHGTAVASLMVGKSTPFSGVSPNAVLYAADIYCGTDTGGALDKLIDALGWLAQEKVAVINLSLVGPPNQTLEHIVKSMLNKGYLLVAAVGNDGPAAPPLYPASYPGVIGVTAVDAKMRVLPEAARGAQVMIAAPGSNMVAATKGKTPFQAVRGTSFASPIVAALLAKKVFTPNVKDAKKALEDLIKQAKTDDPDKVTQELGHGIVGTSFRTGPEQFR